MTSILEAHVALIGGSCALLALIIGIVAVRDIRSDGERAQWPRLNEIRKSAVVGSLLFIMAVGLVVFLAKLMLGWMILPQQ